MDESKLPPGPWRWLQSGFEGEVLGLLDADGRKILRLSPDSTGNWTIDGEPEVLRAIEALPTLVDAGEEIPQMLDWLADRLVELHGENPHLDFILAARRLANQTRDALAKIDGEYRTDA
jgi:hypothetical protein